MKLKVIFRDKGMGDSKPSDNIFLDKSHGICIPDIYQWFSFNPLGEIIRADQQLSLIPYCLREMPYNIQGPLSKRSRARQRVKDTPWLVNIWG